MLLLSVCDADDGGEAGNGADGGDDSDGGGDYTASSAAVVYVF